MNLIDFIPIGKKYKKTKQQLMYEAKITDDKEFRRQMAELQNKYIIIWEYGYYLPSTKEEYMEVIKKLEQQKEEKNRIIKLAYREMEGKKNEI